MSKRRVRDNVRSRMEKKQDESTGYGYLKLEGISKFDVSEECIKRIDIIPYEVKSNDNPYAEKGTIHYERTFYTHRIELGDNNTRTVICPMKTNGSPCPVCEEYKRMQEANADYEDFKHLKPKDRQLYNVIDLSDRDKGIQVWDLSYYSFGKLLDTKLRNADEDDDYDSFPETDCGKTLKLTFVKGAFKDYFPVEDIEFKERKKQYDDSIIDDAHDLDSLLDIKSYNEIKQIMNGVNEPKEEEPKRKRKEEPEEDSDNDEKPVKNKCPHGHKFGKDWDKYEDCDDCECYDECDEA